LWLLVFYLGTGFICELVIRKVKKPIIESFLCGVILAALLPNLIELAVGIFGTLS
jgi:hypothetical protein